MEVIKVYDIKEPAQEFTKTPKIKKFIKDEILVFDYETETGDYELTGITFKDVVVSRHTKDSQVERYMINAYNAVAIVKNSPWMSSFEKNFGDVKFEHYLIYFDGYGAYEFIAKEVMMGIDDVEFS